jgi:hypothetical protein
MTTLKHYSIVSFLTVLAACAATGLTPASSFAQNLAYAYAEHTAVLQATTNAVNSGALSSADAQAVLTQADTAKAALDAAVAFNTAGDLTDANTKLALGTAALTALQTYLNTHQGK